MTVALCVVFLLSGAAALVFETLWFRQSGLALGNTVWASALVTASFMAGLAIGNAVCRPLGPARSPPAARLRRARDPGGPRPGLVLVLVVLPLVGHALAPLMGSVGRAGPQRASAWPSRSSCCCVPSIAMGATLPLLASALSAKDANFGRVLGRLYGWNTLGAFLGTLAGDLRADRGARGSAAPPSLQRGPEPRCGRRAPCSRPRFGAAAPASARASRRPDLRSPAGAALARGLPLRRHPARAGGGLVPLPAAFTPVERLDLRGDAGRGAAGNRGRRPRRGGAARPLRRGRTAGRRQSAPRRPRGGGELHLLPHGGPSDGRRPARDDSSTSSAWRCR